MAKSPLQLIASDGLLSNQGLDIPADLKNAINNRMLWDYYGFSDSQINLVTPVGLSGSIPLIGRKDSSGASLPDSTTNDLESLLAAHIASFWGHRTIQGSTTFDSGNVVKGQFSVVCQYTIDNTDPLNPVYTLSGYTYSTPPCLGTPDLSIFTQYPSMAKGLVEILNDFINSTQGVEEEMEATFTDMDALTSGGITNITKSFDTFRTDLDNAGRLIDLGNIANFGTPIGLLTVLANNGSLIIFKDELEANGLSAAGIMEKIALTEPIAKVIEKKFYDTLKTITGTRLELLKQVLRVNVDLDNGSDLLNIKKVFKNSYSTLTSPTVNGLENIFTGAGGLNDSFNKLGTEYYSMMPPEHIDAARALVASFQGISGLEYLSMSDFKEMVSSVNSMDDLSEIANLTEPVPASVKTSLAGSFANGTGTDGRYRVSDGIGSAADYLMNYYGDATAISNHVAREIDLFQKAGIAIGIQTGNQLSIITFVDSMPGLGLDTSAGGIREILEKCATNDQAGQAVIGVLREGENNKNIGGKKPFGMNNIPKPVIK